MTTIIKFNQRVVGLIHGLPCEEALKKEDCYYNNNGKIVNYFPYPITIGRVMKALKNNHDIEYKKGLDFIFWENIGLKVKMKKNGRYNGRSGRIEGRTFEVCFSETRTIEVCDPEYSYAYEKECFEFISKLYLEQKINTVVKNWKLTKKNGQECTSFDQSEKTLLKLLEILGG